MTESGLGQATDRTADPVRDRFFDPAGRLRVMPAKRSRQLAVLDVVAQRFTPGEHYTEPEVNRELMGVFDDYVRLRRDLVDAGMLDRADGRYWRSGGSVPGPVPPDPGAPGAGSPSAGPAPSQSTPQQAPQQATPQQAPPHHTRPRQAPAQRAPATTGRGARRRAAIVAAAAELFARRGYPGVGMDDIGAAAGVTGPAIYRHFDSKAAVLAAVIDSIIDAVAPVTVDPPDPRTSTPADRLAAQVSHYAAGVAQRRELMAVFVREVHHLPDEHAERLRQRQRALVARWRTLLTEVHPDWPPEQVRTGVHAVFGMLNAVGTFSSPLPDADLGAELAGLACRALDVPSRPGGDAAPTPA